jgi:hypothetical protein
LKTNGSEPWYHSDFLTINEHAWVFQIPVDVLRPKLLNQGINANPHDRLPFQVVADALTREGWRPEPLARVR